MSQLSLKRQATKSVSRGLTPDVKDGTFAHFMQVNFLGGIPPHFTRKDIRHQLLRIVPDSEKKNCVAIWKVILRFMGDVADYRANLSETYQPNLGSVMSRLYAQLGISPSSRVQQRQASIFKKRNVSVVVPATVNNNANGSAGESPASSTVEDAAAILEGLNVSQKKKGGTLRRIKESISLTFSRSKDSSIFHDLPLEESLLTPLEQVHFILGFGILKPVLRDEIYCQVCKQLINNPFKTSLARGWLLLSLICSTFPPTEFIMKYFIQFMDEGPPMYAINCKKALQRTLRNGSRHQPSSYVEMEAGLQKKLLEVPVTLMDGSMQSLSVDSATTAREISQHLAEIIGLRDQFGFAIYISMHDKVASMGNGDDHIFDAISQCEQIYREGQNGHIEGPAPWRLFFRKEMFSPWDGAVTDVVATNLIFAQVARGVLLGEYVCDQDNQLAVLAAQQYFVEYGAEINEDSLIGLLPSYIPPAKLEENDALVKWRKSIVKAHHKLFSPPCNKTQERVKQEVVHFAKTRWPMAFSRYYDVTKLEGPDWPEDEVSLAVNWTGVFVVDDGETLHEMTFPEITSISDGGPTSPTTVMFILVNGAAFQFSCPDAEDLRNLVNFMITGLKKRSIHTVAVETHQRIRAGELSHRPGDLITLTEPLGERLSESLECGAVQDRTGDVGSVHTSRIYVLPTLTKPGDDILRLFQSGRHG